MRFLAISLLIMLSACASRTVAPVADAFPRRIDAKSCPDLDGLYRNLGMDQTGEGVFLSNVLEPLNAAFEDEKQRYLAYRRVAHITNVFAKFKRQKDGAEDITLRAVDRALVLHPLPGKGQVLRCKDSWLEVEYENPDALLGLSKLSKRLASFSRAADGGLVMKEGKKPLLALLTSRKDTAKWYYFPTYEKPKRVSDKFVNP